MRIINEWKNVSFKNCKCYKFDDTIKIENIYFDNILLNEKSCEDNLIYEVLHKNVIGAKAIVHYVQWSKWVY